MTSEGALRLRKLVEYELRQGSGASAPDLPLLIGRFSGNRPLQLFGSILTAVDGTCAAGPQCQDADTEVAADHRARAHANIAEAMRATRALRVIA